MASGSMWAWLKDEGLEIELEELTGRLTEQFLKDLNTFL